MKVDGLARKPSGQCQQGAGWMPGGALDARKRLEGRNPAMEALVSETVGMEPCDLCFNSPSHDSDVLEVLFNLLHVMSILSQISTRGQLLFLNLIILIN